MTIRESRRNNKGPQAELIIRNGTIISGCDEAPYIGDIAVEGKHISAIGDLSAWSAYVEIDATGAVIAPGFIDVHTHDDAAVIDTPKMHNKVQQGVTTLVVGNCGVSLAPILPAKQLPPAPFQFLGTQSSYQFETMFAYQKAVKRASPNVNVITLVGHTTLRAAVMDDLSGAASDDELVKMKRLLEQSLSAGCVGLSTGLAYPPAIGAPTREVCALADVVGKHRGVYATHVRDEADHLVEAVEEALLIARISKTSLLLSHHKCMGKANWGKSKATLKLINARITSVDIGIDVYPYIASSTALLAHKIRHAERVIVTESAGYPDLAGKDLSEIATLLGCSEEKAVAKLAPAKAIYFQMAEDDLVRIMKHPATMIGSDGMPSDRHPHPRLFGTFPRVLGKYVREEGHLSLVEAIRKMTLLPALKFNLTDRGRLQKGCYADIIIFDPNIIIDKATYSKPTQPPVGIGTVLFEGHIVHHQDQSLT